MPLRASHLLIVALLAACSGCAEPAIEQEPVYSVTGKILVRGKPATGAIVCFHPRRESPSASLRSHGEVAADGTFDLTTYVKADGARASEYVVTLFWPDVPTAARSEDEESSEVPPDRLKGRFANQQTSILRAAVGSAPVEFEPIDLESPELKQSSEFQLRPKS